MPYKVHLPGSFSSTTFYDDEGQEILDLDLACEQAEKQFGDVNWEVFDHCSSATREEWLKNVAFLSHHEKHSA